MGKLLKIFKILVSRLWYGRTIAIVLSSTLTSEEKEQLKLFLLEFKRCTHDPYELLDQLPDRVRSVAMLALKSLLDNIPTSVAEQAKYINDVVDRLLAIL